MRRIVEGFEDTQVVPIEAFDAEGDPLARDVMHLQQDDDTIEVDKRQANALIDVLQDFLSKVNHDHLGALLLARGRVLQDD